MEHSAFVTKSSSIIRELRNDVLITSRYVVGNIEPEQQNWRGLWDTGASATCIHKRVKEKMGLQVLGTATISTANGEIEVDTCMIDVILPSKVKVNNLLVSCAEIGKDVDILLGMDIICLGNFSVSNVKETYYSLVIPSTGHINYVQYIKNKTQIEQGHKKKKKGRK